MHPVARTLSLLTAAVALSSCSPKFEDVSNIEPYRSNLGQVCTSSLPLRAHGVTNTVEREKSTDTVLVSELRLSGPEITFAAPLQAQTSIRLDAAQRCTNCILEAQARFLVTVSPSVAQASGVPVYVRAEAVASGVLQCK